MSEFTDEQILTAISDALKARDFEAVASLLCLLAVQAPEKAEAIQAVVQMGASR